MALTRTQMVSEICDIVGKSATASSVSGAILKDRVVRYLNFAQERIARYHNWHELNILLTTATLANDIKRYPISSGTDTLGLVRPKDILSIRLIDAENSRKLDRWSYRKFDTHYPRPENYSNGRPRIYIRHGNFLEFFRVPNDSYSLSIRYAQWPAPLNSDSQTTDYENKDQLLVSAGILETYLALEEYIDAKIWFERLLGQLNDARKAEGDVDWEPEAEPHGDRTGYASSTPWNDPYAVTNDPLYGYN